MHFQYLFLGENLNSFLFFTGERKSFYLLFRRFRNQIYVDDTVFELAPKTTRENDLSVLDHFWRIVQGYRNLFSSYLGGEREWSKC